MKTLRYKGVTIKKRQLGYCFSYQKIFENYPSDYYPYTSLSEVKRVITQLIQDDNKTVEEYLKYLKEEDNHKNKKEMSI